MDDEELLMQALMGLYGPEEEEDPYAEFAQDDIYAPQGLPFIPQKTNSRGETDMNAAFNAMQDWVQMQSDPNFMALLSAQTGTPLVDYNQQAPMAAPVHTPTLDSLRQSGDEVLANVATAIDAGRTPFDIESTMRAAGTYDDDQIDLAVRAAERAFEENGFAQRAEMENAAAQSPLEQAYAEAGLPSPMARYGDPGYEAEEMPFEVRRQDQDILGRYDEQLAALERLAEEQAGRPEYTPTGSVWRDLPGGRGNMDDPVMQEYLANRPEVAERMDDTHQQREIANYRDERESDRQVFDELAGVEREDPFAYRPGDSDGGGGITGSVAPGALTPPPAVRQERWPGDARDRRAELSAPSGGWLDSGLRSISRMFGGGGDEDRMTAAFGTPLDLTTPQDRGPAADPSSGWQRSTPASPRREEGPSSSERYGNAVRSRRGTSYSARSRANVVRQNRDAYARRSDERLERSRQIIANGLAARGRSPLSDAANARQALMRQVFGI